MDRIPERLIQNLTSQKRTIAIAEAGTGGLLAQTLSAVPGAERFLRSGVVILDADGMNRLAGVRKSVCRRYGLGSKEAAAAMADGVRRKDSSTIGIGVSGTDNGALHAAVCIKNGPRTWMALTTAAPFPEEDPDRLRQRTVSNLLGLLNGYLEKSPDSQIGRASCRERV